VNDDTGDRDRLIEHLLTHPGHKHSPVAGRNFEHYTTGNIMRLHDKLHMTPGKPWAHKDEGDSMTSKKTLDLKVTVEDPGPDGRLAAIIREDLWLKGSPSGRGIRVTHVERADGQPVGAEAAFEAWWTEGNCAGDDEDSTEKEWAHDAFLYGIKYAKEKKA
jgi:hypothetical protein